MQIVDKKYCFDALLCPICTSKSTVVDVVKITDIECEDTMSLRSCSLCRHWWIDPLPKQEYLSRLYATNSLLVGCKSSDEESIKLKVDNTMLQRYVCKILKHVSKSGNFNFLEVGVGWGHVFKYFSEKANLCYGVEPGSRKPSHPNIVSDIENIPKNIQFDIIVIQDVLEHLSDPIAMLSKLRNIANKNCVITTGFPNKDSLQAQLKKGKWRMIRPLGHIHFFSSRSIITAFHKSGWEIIEKQNCRPAQISLWQAIWHAIKIFNWKLFKNPFLGIYKLSKSILVQLLIEKDQWFVQARA
jgi:hypothetical protein